MDIHKNDYTHHSRTLKHHNTHFDATFTAHHNSTSQVIQNSNSTSNHYKMMKNNKLNQKKEKVVKNMIVDIPVYLDERTQSSDNFIPNKALSQFDEMLENVYRVCQKLQLKRETVQLAVQYLNNLYRTQRPVFQDNYKTIPIASIFIAIKMLEVEIQGPRDIRNNFANANVNVTVKDILNAELLVAHNLDWRLCPETIYDNVQQLYYKFKVQMNNDRDYIYLQQNNEIQFLIWIWSTALSFIEKDSLNPYEGDTFTPAAILYITYQLTNLTHITNIDMNVLCEIIETIQVQLSPANVQVQKFVKFVEDSIVDFDREQFLEKSTKLVSIMRNRANVFHLVFKRMVKFDQYNQKNLAFYDSWIQKICVEEVF